MTSSVTVPDVPLRDAPPRVLRPWLFRGAALLLAWLVIELCAAGVLLLQGNWRILRELQWAIAISGAPRNSPQEVIHPYVGWVTNPDFPSTQECCGKPVGVNEQGLLDTGPALHQRSPERLIVGICGGSVAWQFSYCAEERLRAGLQQLPLFSGREIVIVRLAAPGYKQPQGLQLLTYLLSLGAEFDVLINLDGFNEIVLPLLENIPSEITPAYPRMWHLRMLDCVDPADFALSERLRQIRAKRQAAAQWGYHHPCGRLPSAQLSWSLRDRIWHYELVRLQAELTAGKAARGTTFLQRGPRQPPLSTAAVLEESAAIWERCSLQLHRLCEANDMTYLHFLQPNQYVAGSKPLSEFELERCYWQDSAVRQTVMAGYPLLLERVQQLRAAGVNCTDLTQAFAKTTETLYVDPWCHFNELGNLILAETVLDELHATFTR